MTAQEAMGGETVSQDDPYVVTPPQTRLETLAWIAASAVMLYVMGLMVIGLAAAALARRALRGVRR